MTMAMTRQLSGEHSSLADASYLQIIGTGVLLGIVHVLTGPDHLSALAAMTTGSSWRAFSLGLRWGCGHSIGLIIMALIFFAAGRTIDLDHVGAYLNYFVGAFMIALGLWTVHQVKKKYKQKQKEFVAVTTSTASRVVPPQPQPLTPMMERLPSHGRGSEERSAATTAAQLQVYERKLSESPAAAAAAAATSSYHLIQVDDDVKSLEGKDASSSMAGGDGDHFQLMQDDHHSQDDDHSYHHGHHHKTPKCCKNVNFTSPTVQRLTALLVGIVHGIAGPGGILGVLPAVVMANWGKSTTYLASFCVSSIFIMGVFAALYGEITGRLGRNSLLIEFRIGVFSAAFSLVVGVGWIVLQATGYMSKVFE